jgi:hypothetical protein
VAIPAMARTTAPAQHPQMNCFRAMMVLLPIE